jgi:spermidine dehydrogenase
MFGASRFDAKRESPESLSTGGVMPTPARSRGFFFGKDGKPAFRDILRNSSFGKIAFANTDLSGDPSHVTAIEEGERAAGQLLDGALVS